MKYDDILKNKIQHLDRAIKEINTLNYALRGKIYYPHNPDDPIVGVKLDPQNYGVLWHFNGNYYDLKMKGQLYDDMVAAGLVVPVLRKNFSPEKWDFFKLRGLSINKVYIDAFKDGLLISTLGDIITPASYKIVGAYRTGNTYHYLDRGLFVFINLGEYVIRHFRNPEYKGDPVYADGNLYNSRLENLGE